MSQVVEQNYRLVIEPQGCFHRGYFKNMHLPFSYGPLHAPSKLSIASSKLSQSQHEHM